MWYSSIDICTTPFIKEFRVQISKLDCSVTLLRKAEEVSMWLVGEAGITAAVADGGRNWKRGKQAVAGPHSIG